jgi:phospholipid/cholesterol/gamma-HCH transport system ATP-binding protein
MANPVIEVDGLECRYGERIVLQGLTFSVERAELLFIAGGSGAGKSTLLRHLIGLQAPARGTIHYGGRHFQCTGAEDVRPFTDYFGVLYQGGALWSSMTIEENIALPLEEHAELTPADRRRLVALKLAQVGLSGVEDLEPGELSGGMRKRAALARAMALDPAILFLDEPSSGLDPASIRQLNELIVRLRRSMGTTMVIVSHHLESILDIADRVILLDASIKGIVAQGPPRALARESRDERVRSFFGTAPA